VEEPPPDEEPVVANASWPFSALLVDVQIEETDPPD
jgi:hypothetical protein